MSSCSDDYTGLQQWGIHYQAAPRSQGQIKDEVFIIDDGTLRELTVEHPIGLAKPMKPFLHYSGNADDLCANDELVIYYQNVASSSIWDLFIDAYQLFRLNESTFNPFLMVGNGTFQNV